MIGYAAVHWYKLFHLWLLVSIARPWEQNDLQLLALASLVPSHLCHSALGLCLLDHPLLPSTLLLPSATALALISALKFRQSCFVVSLECSFANSLIRAESMYRNVFILTSSNQLLFGAFSRSYIWSLWWSILYYFPRSSLVQWASWSHRRYICNQNRYNGSHILECYEKHQGWTTKEYQL